MLLPALVALAVVVPCFARGGYTSESRAVFTALAGAALVVAMVTNEREARRLFGSPVIVVLFALGTLSVLSAAWSVAEPGAAVRAGLTVAGYGSLAVAAGTLGAKRDGGETWARILMLAAAATALAGIGALALHHLPWAERIRGTWRPGGPFEYPPALALAQVAAVPAYLSTMVRMGRGWGLSGAAGGALAALVLATSGSRTALAAALLILVAAIAFPQQTVGARRVAVIAAALLLCASGAAGRAVQSATDSSASGVRLTAFIVVVAGAAGSWLVIRPLAERARARPVRTRMVVIAGLIAGVAAIAVAAASGHDGLSPRSGIAHGRTKIWRAAALTVADRPVVGAGADSFLQASIRHQGRHRTRYAHNLPLELAAELGVLGAMLAGALYLGTARELRRAAPGPQAFVVVPFAGLFLVANLLDWEWHQAGVGAIWAVCLGASANLVRQQVSPRR